MSQNYTPQKDSKSKTASSHTYQRKTPENTASYTATASNSLS